MDQAAEDLLFPALALEAEVRHAPLWWDLREVKFPSVAHHAEAVPQGPQGGALAVECTGIAGGKLLHL